MTISLNGEQTDADDASTVADLVQRLGIIPQTVLVEHNGVALHRREWPEAQLHQGDRLEFLRVVAGR